jgi:hypothetical protein
MAPGAKAGRHAQLYDRRHIPALPRMHAPLVARPSGPGSRHHRRSRHEAPRGCSSQNSRQTHAATRSARRSVPLVVGSKRASAGQEAHFSFDEPAGRVEPHDAGDLTSASASRTARAAAPRPDPCRRLSSSEELPTWVRAGRSALRDCAGPVGWLWSPPARSCLCIPFAPQTAWRCCWSSFATAWWRSGNTVPTTRTQQRVIAVIHCCFAQTVPCWARAGRPVARGRARRSRSTSEAPDESSGVTDPAVSRSTMRTLVVAGGLRLILAPRFGGMAAATLDTFMFLSTVTS